MLPKNPIKDAIRDAYAGVKGPHEDLRKGQYVVFVPVDYEGWTVGAEKHYAQGTRNQYAEMQRVAKVERVCMAVSLLCPFVGPVQRGVMREDMRQAHNQKKGVEQLVRKFYTEYAG